MSEHINTKELDRDLHYAIKSELVKGLLTNQDLGTSWNDPLHDSTHEMQKKDEEHRKVMSDYHEHNDWKHDPDYQKAMKLSLDRIAKYGLDGKADSKELKAEQKRFDFKVDHPILSKFF